MSWIKLKTDFFDNPRIMELNEFECAVYLYCLCRVGREPIKKMHRSCRVLPERFPYGTRKKHERFKNALQKLSDFGLLSFEMCDATDARLSHDPYARVDKNRKFNSNELNLSEPKALREKKPGRSASAKKPSGSLPKVKKVDSNAQEVLGSEIGAPATGGVEVNAVIRAYTDFWKARYQTSPPITGKQVGILKNLVKSLGRKKVLELLEAFFKMPDASFVQQSHSVEVFNFNLNRIQSFISTGQVVSKRKAFEVDEKSYYEEQRKRDLELLSPEQRKKFWASFSNRDEHGNPINQSKIESEKPSD